MIDRNQDERYRRALAHVQWLSDMLVQTTMTLKQIADGHTDYPSKVAADMLAQIREENKKWRRRSS